VTEWSATQMASDRVETRPLKLRIRQRLRRMRVYKRVGRLEQVPDVRRLTDTDIGGLRIRK
jgi:hypothetical protein